MSEFVVQGYARQLLLELQAVTERLASMNVLLILKEILARNEENVH